MLHCYDNKVSENSFDRFAWLWQNNCNNENLSRRAKKRTRIIIDIPEGFNVETV